MNLTKMSIMQNFSLPYILERDQRPRAKALTMMKDKGLSLSEAANFIEANEGLTDIVKFGFGTAFVTNQVEENTKLYKKHNIRPYFGGTLFEAFYARGMFEDYLRLIDKYDLDLAEISDGSIIIPHDEKCELIHTMAKNTTVLSEVGSKDSGILKIGRAHV